jgi:ankyrin repeat protein
MDLWVAAQEGRKEDVEALLADLSRGVIVEALHIAVANDHLDVVKLLVRQETVTVNQQNAGGSTPLGTAAWHGNADVASFLLAARAQLNMGSRNERWTPLAFAAIQGHVQVASRLHACKASQSVTRFLTLVASNGHADMVSLLPGQKADVNTPDVHGWTALHYAAFNGHAAVVAHLLRASAQVDVVTLSGFTPLDLARIEKHSGVVALLRSQCASP